MSWASECCYTRTTERKNEERSQRDGVRGIRSSFQLMAAVTCWTYNKTAPFIVSHVWIRRFCQTTSTLESSWKRAWQRGRRNRLIKLSLHGMGKRKSHSQSLSVIKKIKVQHGSLDSLPWKSIARPIDTGLDGDDGILELEEVDNVEVVYEEKDGGKVLKFLVRLPSIYPLPITSNISEPTVGLTASRRPCG